MLSQTEAVECLQIRLLACDSWSRIITLAPIRCTGYDALFENEFSNTIDTFALSINLEFIDFSLGNPMARPSLLFVAAFASLAIVGANHSVSLRNPPGIPMLLREDRIVWSSRIHRWNYVPIVPFIFMETRFDVSIIAEIPFRCLVTGLLGTSDSGFNEAIYASPFSRPVIAPVNQLAWFAQINRSPSGRRIVEYDRSIFF